MKDYRVVTGKELDKMFRNGWTSRTVRPSEYTEEVIEQLKTYYSKVKAYKTRTAIRGYYQDVIMVKR